jgi:hypothetical protein
VTDDLHDKCKRIAQWLGEYEERTVYPLGRTYSTQWYTETVRELDDGMIVEAEWPAYDKSDASAWRAFVRLDDDSRAAVAYHGTREALVEEALMCAIDGVDDE